MSEFTYIEEKECYEIVPDRCNVTLRDFLLSRNSEMNFGIPSFCGGNGLCGKCIVNACGGLTSPDKLEMDFLSEKQLKEGFRLACRAYLTGEKVYIKHPAVTEINSENSVVTDWFATDDLKIEKGKVGVAIDVGTTTIAVYLLMRDGSVLKNGFLNPLQSFGSDVITIMDSIEKKTVSLREMQKKLISAIEKAILCLTESSNTVYDEIGEIVIAGNTVMEHIICGLDPCGMSSFPYLPKSLFGVSYLSDLLGFKKIHNVDVYVMPCVSAFVGGDVAAGMLASGILSGGDERRFDSAVLYIDIGTNGELVLYNGSKSYACSCAAGPAFEGANIECGTFYHYGAVESVGVAEQTRENEKNQCISDVEFEYKTVGGCSPDGICGSGIVDATATMLNVGLIDETGRMMVEEEKIYIDKEKRIYITSKDIRNIQLAKSAIATGIEVLLKYAEISDDDIGKVFLAGGFGTKLNKHSFCRIGAVPSKLECKTISLGNMSGAGALMCLYNQENRNNVCRTIESVEYIELSDEKDFPDIFTDNMLFDRVNL